MVHNKKPHLASIQEFGATAYVKDLKAGKLDAHAQLGQFVGYDSESKGYRIYWPGKRSISVEHNVMFNQDDIQINDSTVSISGGVQFEGEMESEKVIQYPVNHVKDPEKVDMEKDVDSQPEKEALNKGQDCYYFSCFLRYISFQAVILIYLCVSFFVLIDSFIFAFSTALCSCIASTTALCSSIAID